IFREAFNPTAGVAGTGVGAFLVTLMWGVRRGLFSNEAGQGSAPIAHAAARTDEPVSEGVVALLEPFIDTIVICTFTGLVIIMTGVWSDRLPTEITLGGGDVTYIAVGGQGGNETVDAPREITITDGVHGADDVHIGWHDAALDMVYVDPGMTRPFTGTIDPVTGVATTPDGQTYTSLWAMAAESGAPLTQEGFRRGLAPIGDWGGFIVVLAVLLFAISTAISWSYYGDRCANYLLGPNAVLPYKIVFVIMHFIGAVLPLTTIWDLGDIFLAIVIVPNLIALILLSPQVVEETRSYFERKPWIENEAAHRAWKEKQRRER
ncbi:MAG TPA: sodium:alanine symporter family protein, partial [Alphaproteobacteria bacterium]|nr:sodium:alanine symporter family protein [Alphaproteobacteria bacterium]